MDKKDAAKKGSLSFSDAAGKDFIDLSDDAILGSKSFSLPQKDYLLSIKYGEEYSAGKTLRQYKQGAYVCFRDRKLFSISAKNFFVIRILEIRGGKLILDGLDHSSVLGEDYELVALDDKGRRICPETFHWRHRDLESEDGEAVYRGHRFRFEIPIDKAAFNLAFYIEDPERRRFRLSPSFGMYGKLNAGSETSYYARGGYIVRVKGKELAIRRARKRTLLKAEFAVQRGLIKDGQTKTALIRLLGFLVKLLHKKPIWLIRDNEKRAKDSGAEMFRYYAKSGLKERANAYFILDKDSSDYAELRKYGRIIQPYGLRYKVLHLACDTLIDTRGKINARYIFNEDYRYFMDLCDWDYIWIIHGVMARNFARWINRQEFNSKIVVTTTVREYESVLKDSDGYGYSEKEVKLTGLPRHDTLTDRRQKKVLFLPTWRKDLAGDLIPGTDEREYVENFRETDYAKFYNSLINNSELLDSMRKYGYTGEFYLHPSFIKQAGDFDENDVIKIGREAADANRLICECSVLVTDYSSAQFEGAYLNRPLVYSQFDADTYNERHTGENGYFSWENDSFGPVCSDEESTVKAIIRYLENGCINEEPYTSRAREFFVYRDKNNARRVYEQILNL